MTDAIKTGSAASAVKIRVFINFSPQKTTDTKENYQTIFGFLFVFFCAFSRLTYSAETAVAFLKIDNRREEIFQTKIGKKRRRDVNFAVGELPQQKI